MQSRDKAVKFSVNNSKKTVTRHQAFSSEPAARNRTKRTPYKRGCALPRHGHAIHRLPTEHQRMHGKNFLEFPSRSKANKPYPGIARECHVWERVRGEAWHLLKANILKPFCIARRFLVCIAAPFQTDCTMRCRIAEKRPYLPRKRILSVFGIVTHHKNFTPLERI